MGKEEESLSEEEKKDGLTEEKSYTEIAKDIQNHGEDALKDELLSVEKRDKKIQHVGMKHSLIIVSTAILLIAALIAGYMLFGTSGEEANQNVKILYDYEDNEIQRIELFNHTYKENIVLTPFMNGTVQDWNIEGQQYDDVNQLKVKYLVQWCGHMETKYVLEYDAAKLEEYGLAEPASTVKISYTDGSEHTIYIGREYGSREGVYLMLDDVREIYIVSVYVMDYTAYRTADMLNLPGLDKTSLNCQTLYFINSDRTTVQLSYIPGPLSGAEAWYMLLPTISETNTDAVDALFEGIGNLEFNSYVAEQVGEDTALYGFDKPLYELQSYDSDTNLLDHLVIGSKVEDSEDLYYCALLSDPEADFSQAKVYTISAEVLAPLNVSAVDLVNPYLLALNIYWLRSGVFRAGGQEYILTIDRKLQYDDAGNVLLDDDGVESTLNTYYINGKKLDELQFKTFYSKVLFLSIEGVVPNDTEKGEELFSYSLEVEIPITDQQTGKSYIKQATYEGAYYKISDTYAVFKNNESDNAVFTVRCRSIDSVVEALGLLLEGRMPTA